MSDALLTTSWDDGNVLDFKVADLLAKYGLTGTFYIPRDASTTTMSPAHVRDLAGSFEIGAHTIEHVFLPDVDLARAEGEITGSKKWVEQTTGRPCTMFCPPAGRFHRDHLRLVRVAGFTGVRTVEMLSLDHPRVREGLLIMPTTLQACVHSPWTFAKNFAKRRAFRNLWLYILHAHGHMWHDNVRNLLAATLTRGGVFHLWGHSWEIQEQKQWDRLEYVLKLMGEIRDQAPCLTNAQICSRTRFELHNQISGSSLLNPGS